MKFSIAASVLALAAAASAQTPLTQSKPFNLKLSSSNSTLNGKYLSSCDTQAGYAATICVGAASPFRFNYTKGQTPPVPGYTSSGYLARILHFEDGPPAVSVPMSLGVDILNNMAGADLIPVSDDYFAQSVVFNDKDGSLGVVDYSVVYHTNTSISDPVKKNWYICPETDDYSYQGLAWKIGDGSGNPNDPSCVKVNVQRYFVK